MSDEDATPLWDWSTLTAAEYDQELRRLAEWVTWLEDAFEPWVELPPCWPLHEALRSELALFWYWQRAVYESTHDASEGVRWHQSLRESAGEWRRLSGCTHEEPAAYREAMGQQRRERVDDALRKAVQELG